MRRNRYWAYYWSSPAKQEFGKTYFKSKAEAMMYIESREDYHHGGTVMEYNADGYNTRNWELIGKDWEQI